MTGTILVERRNIMAPRRNNLTEGVLEGEPEMLTRCCVPGECPRKNPHIPLEDLRDAVRVTCSNEACTAGRYMHRECFEAWEQSVLAYLVKASQRAKNWPDKHLAQNVWTGKGYSVAKKACGCRCGRGLLKKDLEWCPPPPGFRSPEEEVTRKKKKKRPQNRHQQHVINGLNGTNGNAANDARIRAGSQSSSNGSMSPPTSASSISPVHSAIKKAVKNKVDFFSDR